MMATIYYSTNNNQQLTEVNRYYQLNDHYIYFLIILCINVIIMCYTQYFSQWIGQMKMDQFAFSAHPHSIHADRHCQPGYQNFGESVSKNQVILGQLFKFCLQLSTYKIMDYQHKKEQEVRAKKQEFAKSLPTLEAKSSTFKLFGKMESHPEDHYQDTMTKPLAVSKIKIAIDQQQTKKLGWEKGFSSLRKSQAKPIQDAQKNKKEEMNAGPEQLLQIPYNKKVQQIMSKKPLRERLSGLLPPDMQLPISFDHQQLLKRMQLIDRTIDFLSSHRNVKIFFFQTIRKSIFETNSILIQLKIIQQLLYLDQHCYSVEWKMNQKIKRYDIKITLPKIQSMDFRKSQMRKKIIKYLIYKEAEFLSQMGYNKVQYTKWHQKFEYKKIQIPERSLPIHPNNLNCDLRAFPDEQIQKVENSALKMLFKKKKNISEVKSLSSASVADMIFSKVPASEITSQILNQVKQKQRMHNQLKERDRIEGQKIDKEAMLKIYDEILLIYMSKNVSNIFKMTLIEMLQQRLKLKDLFISDYVEKILKIQGLSSLKVVESSKKIAVVQIDRQRYKQGREVVAKCF